MGSDFEETAVQRLFQRFANEKLKYPSFPLSVFVVGERKMEKTIRLVIALLET